MSREILFRGKRIDNGELIQGSLITNVFYTEKDHENIPYILNADMAEYDCFEDFNEYNGIYEVDKEKICQYTGLTDKNGKKTFEGDILRGFQYPFCYDGYYNYYAEIIFANCSFMTYTHKNPLSCVREISDGNTELMESWVSEDWEVIGNIYDNPELLEVVYEKE